MGLPNRKTYTDKQRIFLLTQADGCEDLANKHEREAKHWRRVALALREDAQPSKDRKGKRGKKTG